MAVPADTVSEVMQMVRGWKDAWVAGGGFTNMDDDHRFDILPTGIVVRAGQEICDFFAGDIQLVLTGLQIAGGGMAADRLILVADAYTPTPKFFAEDRALETLRPGMMQKLFEEGRKDLAIEAIVATWADRSGGCWIVQQSYEIVDGPAVHWFEGERDGRVTDGPTMGIVPDTLRHTMAHGKDLLLGAEAIGLTENMGLPPEVVRLAADLAVVRMLTVGGLQVKMATRDPEELAAYKAAFSSDGFSYFVTGPEGDD